MCSMAQRVLHCVLLLLVCASATHGRVMGAKQRPGAAKKPAPKQPTAAQCKANIPSCGSGCQFQGANLVCKACRAGYIRATNGLQCVCAAGTYERCNKGSCKCKLCETGFFCPGGSKSAKNKATAAQRGVRFSCHKLELDSTSTTADIQAKGVTTLSPGAKQEADCMPLAGYVMPEGATEAFPCPPNSYSTGGSREDYCTPCENGLAEDPAFTGLRTSKDAVCMVPAGMYLEDGWTWNCTTGHFRSSYISASSDAATKCNPCPKGTTTKIEGATSLGACNVVLPGYNLNSETIAGQGVDGLDGPEPERCPRGTYFEGGDLPGAGVTTCQPCPLGTITLELGAQSRDSCVVPPGYYINMLAGRLSKCPTNILGIGYYRSDFKQWDDSSVQDTDGTKACTPCGQGILSTYNVPDAADTTNTSFVAASPDSCYIEAGWYMAKVPDSVPDEFFAAICGNGSYSMHPERSYGLWEQPCQRCFEHMITLKLGATNWSDCTNAAGWGMIDTDGNVMACSRGWWNPAGSNEQCKPCATGRTTEENPEDMDTAQDSPDDCIVQEGWGIPDSIATTGTAADAELPVEKCPVGTYGPGGRIDSKCIACDAGFNTTKTGVAGQDNSACTKCVAGLGRENPKAPLVCEPCAYGRYQIGYNGWGGLDHEGDGEICLLCPRTRFAYVSSQGKEPSDILDSEGITFTRGSTTIDACTPRLSQQHVHAGQTWGMPDSVYTTLARTTIQECANLCLFKSDNGVGCFAQYDYKTSQCRTGTMPPAAQGSQAKLLVKLIPSGVVSGTISAVGAVGQGSELGSFMDSGFLGAIVGGKSGLYRHLDLSGYSPEDQARMGEPLADPQGVFASLELGGENTLAKCTATCDAARECWAVTVIGNTCTLRTGVHALDVRALYANPKPGSVPGF